jgi:hypothetical protein
MGRGGGPDSRTQTNISRSRLRVRSMPPAAALAATAAHRQARRNVTQTLRICRVNAHFDCCRVFNRSETRGTGRRAGSTTPITLNLINPHVGDARLPESERCGGLRRDVYHSAMNERSPAKDRDHHATAIIEVDDADLRPYGQAAMRRKQSGVMRVLEVRGQPLFCRRSRAG